jgi:hypothetical protein
MTKSNSLKDKAYLLYNNLKENCDNLISYYHSNGVIRFDIATGLAYIDSNGNIQERAKYIKQFDEFGNLIVDNDGKIIYKKILDFEEIKKINQNDGIVSGTMADALIKRATGKVVELYSNDQCLRWGMISLGTTECLLKIKEDINLIPYDIMPLYNVYGDNIYKIDSENESSYGLVHSLPEKIERYSYFLRGQFKAYNYRGDAEILNNPISLWSYTDKSTLSTSLFGLNSLIRMFGNNQIIDLEGHEISISECTNIFSPLASLVNLSDGAFDSLSTRGCKNSYIYSGNQYRDYIDDMTLYDEKKFKQGEIFQYNNYDTIALGLVIEGAVGKGFSEYFDESIWAFIGAEKDGAWLRNRKSQTAVGHSIKIPLLQFPYSTRVLVANHHRIFRQKV